VVIVDIGCGDGRYLLASAAARPGDDFIGLELIPALVEKAAAKAPPNARFIAGDAVAWLQRRAEASVDEVHVYNPQPYYDPAEVHFGMLTAAFFERAWAVLRPEGRLILQTDNKRYGKYLLEAARMHFDLDVLPGPWPDAPQGRTRREMVAMGKKLAILRAVGRRRKKPLAIDPPPPYFDLERPGLRKRRVRRK
jgi:tRNA (guanine-N7-)-methyltransferase